MLPYRDYSYNTEMGYKNKNEFYVTIGTIETTGSFFLKNTKFL